MQTLFKEKSQIFADYIKSDKQINTVEDDQYISNKHICPCCSYTLLRHINGQGVYWYCSHCYQEMPVYNE